MRQKRTTTLTDDYGDAHEYTLIQHGAADGFDLQHRLLHIAGPGLADLVGSVAGDDGELALAGDKIAQAVQQVVGGILREGGHKLVLDVLKYTQRDGKPLGDLRVFNESYQGNYGEMYSAIWWVLKENYGQALTRVPFVQGFGLVPKTLQ